MVMSEVNFVNDRKELLIDVFVEYFGEKYRDRITERINNTTMVLVPRDMVDASHGTYKKIENEAEEERLYRISKDVREFKDRVLDDINLMETLMPGSISENDKNQLLAEIDKNSSQIIKDREKYPDSSGFQQSSFYRESTDALLDLDMSDEDYNICLFAIEDFMRGKSNSQAFTRHYVDEKSNELKHFVVFPLRHELRDQTIIHELLHVIGSDLIYDKDGNEQVKSGLTLSMNNEARDKNEKYIDESVVEYTAGEIARMMAKRNIRISFPSMRGNAYMTMVDLLEPILDDHRDLFEASILTSDPNLLKNNLGEYSDALIDIAKQAYDLNGYEYGSSKKEVIKEKIDELNMTMNRIVPKEIIVQESNKNKQNELGFRNI